MEIHNINPDEITPCTAIPGDPCLQKLIGLYKQIQSEKWSQRIRVAGGQLAAKQWQGLGEIADRYTPETPLHLTVRQDIEVHDLSDKQVPSLQAALKNIGLSGFSAAGDTLRNITLCPCNGLRGNTIKLLPVANAIDSALRTIDGIYGLPRKFKIGLSCSRDCGQPWINDLGLTVVENNGRIGFAAIVAGSLGAKPATGIKLFDWVDPADVIALVVAAVEMFKTYGDRQNRKTARLRHVRQRLGNEKFVELLTEAFVHTKAQKHWPAVPILKSDKTYPVSVALKFPNGDITSAAATALAKIQRYDNIEVRIDVHHCIRVFATDETDLNKAIASHANLNKVTGKSAWVVACPGKRWCRHGLVHTNELADALRNKLAGQMYDGEIICISGCPNGCAHSAVASIGLTGCLTHRDKKTLEAFNVLYGGELGKTARIAQPVASKLIPQEVLLKIETLLN